MVPAHSSQPIAKRAAPYCPEPPSCQGPHALLWWIIRAVHRSAISGRIIVGRPAISRLAISRIGIDMTKFVFRAISLLPWHSHRGVHGVPLPKEAAEDEEAFYDKCRQE